MVTKVKQMSLPMAGSQSAPVPLETPTRQRMVLALILGIIITIAFFDRVNVAVLAADSAFLADMGIKGQPIKIGLLMSAFLAPYGIANILLSPLADYLGPRKAMFIAISSWGITMIFGGIVTTFAAMIATRVVLGLGEGMHYPMQSTFIKKWFPPAERGRANSVYIVGQSLAPAAAMPFFTWVVYAMGWRSSFFVCVAISLIPLYLLWFHTTDTPREHKKVNTLELQHIEDGLREEARAMAAASEGTVWASAKTFLFNYHYWLLVIWTACMSCISWGLLSWMPSYLVVARRFSWAQMGALSSLPFILAIVAKTASGWLSDRAGRRAPFCLAAMIGGAAGIYSGATIANNVAAALLISFGYGIVALGIPPAWTLMQGFAPGKSISIAAGTMNGLAIGMGALSPVAIGFFIGLSGSYASGLFFLVGTALVGMAAGLILVCHKY
jgi:sugar phosphate permease